jgi:phosphate/sulfate permease
MNDYVLSWLIAILAGITIAIIVVILIRKFVFKKETSKFYILTVVGTALTTLGLVFLKNFNKIISLFGFKLPFDTEPVTPEDLKNIIKTEGDKAKEEKQRELEQKTPDQIIDTELPPDAANAVHTDIEEGKEKIDDLFKPDKSS